MLKTLLALIFGVAFTAAAIPNLDSLLDKAQTQIDLDTLEKTLSGAQTNVLLRRKGDKA